MPEDQKPQSKPTKWTRLIARILSVPIITYALLLLIGYTVSWLTTGTADPHAVEDYPFIENLPPIFMFLAIIGLAVAWKKEKLGGIINLAFCLATLPILLIHWPVAQDPRFITPYIILSIIMLPGVLLLIHAKSSCHNTVLKSHTRERDV